MEQEIIKLLDRLISFRSISANKDESTRLINFVENYLLKTNLIVKKFANNGFPSLLIYGKNHNVTKPFRLLLNAHLDVVPAPDKMFKMIIKDGKTFGRGVYDMKGAAAVMIELFKNLSINNQPSDDIGLALVTDEEIGGFYGTKFLLEKGVAKTRFFLGGEPTDLKILTAHKGAMKIVVTYNGKATHGSTPWDGKNAIIDMANAVNSFYQKNPLPKKEVWATTYSLNLLTGGVAFNVVPDKAEALFDIRRIEEDKPTLILKKIKECFSEAQIKVTMDEPGLNTNANTHEIKQLIKIAEKNTGKKISIVKGHYATDARFYYQKKVPAIHFGPIGGGMHQKNEWVDLQSLKNYYKMLENFLSTITS